MKELKISTTAKPNKNNELKEEVSVELSVQFPTTVKEAESFYGSSELFLNQAERQYVVDFQAVVRRLLTTGKTAKQIQAYLDNVNVFSKDPNAPVLPWKPGISAAKTSSTEKIASKLAEYSPEVLAKVLELAKKKKAEKKAA